MHVNSRLLFGSALVLAFAATAAAQDKTPGAHLLVIQREYVKPGKNGTAHEKAESAFVQAMARAKSPTHYIAFESVSGKPRVLFFTNYDSFDAWEKDQKDVEKNATLSTALDRANENDGTLLDSTDEGVFVLDTELSFNIKPDLSHRRLLEIWSVHVKPGKDSKWRELNKLYRTAYAKAVPNGHWGSYQALYGAPNGTYLYLTARDSASELDRGPAEWKAIAAEIGEDGMKKLDEMFADCVEESQSQLFTVSAAMSYPPDEYIKADPDFWQHKQPTTSAEKKADSKATSVAEKKP